MGFPAAFPRQVDGAIGRDGDPLALRFADRFQIDTSCFDPIACEQIRSPVKRENLSGP